MDNVVLYSKLANLPEHMRLEVSNFIDLLLSQAKKNRKNNSTSTPKFGSAKGMFIMKEGFNEPLADFKDYMTNE